MSQRIVKPVKKLWFTNVYMMIIQSGFDLMKCFCEQVTLEDGQVQARFEFLHEV